MSIYLTILVATVAACFGLQHLALKAVGGRTAKSESNYFSSLARIQAGTKGQPEIMLLGSSITGRLPDRSQGYAGISNLGCDGGSAVDVLMAMDQGILPAGPLIVIEANSLTIAVAAPRTEISLAMEGWWFQLGLRWAALSATARPSAFAYSMLLGRRTGMAETPGQGGTLGQQTLPGPVAPAAGTALAEVDRQFVGRVSEIIGRLQARGSRFVIVWLPPKRAAGAGPVLGVAIAQAVARQTGARWWDLATDATVPVKLTDGVHMDSSSAAKTTRSLLEGLR